jgi:hypothetical protein
MRTKEELNTEYGRLCTLLGDAHTKARNISRLVLEITDQIKALEDESRALDTAEVKDEPSV